MAPLTALARQVGSTVSRRSGASQNLAELGTLNHCQPTLGQKTADSSCADVPLACALESLTIACRVRPQTPATIADHTHFLHAAQRQFGPSCNPTTASPDLVVGLVGLGDGAWSPLDINPPDSPAQHPATIAPVRAAPCLLPVATVSRPRSGEVPRTQGPMN